MADGGRALPPAASRICSRTTTRKLSTSTRRDAAASVTLSQPVFLTKILRSDKIDRCFGICGFARYTTSVRLAATQYRNAGPLRALCD